MKMKFILSRILIVVLIIAVFIGAGYLVRWMFSDTDAWLNFLGLSDLYGEPNVFYRCTALTLLAVLQISRINKATTPYCLDNKAIRIIYRIDLILEIILTVAFLGLFIWGIVRYAFWPMFTLSIITGIVYWVMNFIFSMLFIVGDILNMIVTYSLKVIGLAAPVYAIIYYL